MIEKNKEWKNNVTPDNENSYESELFPNNNKDTFLSHTPIRKRNKREENMIVRKKIIGKSK
jgi:hypothetical protein